MNIIYKNYARKGGILPKKVWIILYCNYDGFWKVDNGLWPSEEQAKEVLDRYYSQVDSVVLHIDFEGLEAS